MSICLFHMKKPCPCLKKARHIQDVCFQVFLCMCALIRKRVCSLNTHRTAWMRVLTSLVLTIIMVMVFIYDYIILNENLHRRCLFMCMGWKKVDSSWMNAVRRCSERSTSQEESGRVEDGDWGRGVNSSLFGEREKRESRLCLHVDVVPCVIDHIYVLVFQWKGFHIEILDFSIL